MLRESNGNAYGIASGEAILKIGMGASFVKESGDWWGAGLVLLTTDCSVSIFARIYIYKECKEKLIMLKCKYLLNLGENTRMNN